MITIIEKYRVVNGDKVLEKSIEVGKQEKADKKELQALFNNIQELMEENALNPDNKKYDKHIKGMVVEGIYFGEYTLTVKQLLTIWSNNIWRDGNKFYYGLGGSPLSGMSFWEYYDIKEKKFGTDEGRGFMDKVRQIMPYKLFHQLHLTPELKKNIQQAVKDGMKEESKNNAAYKRSLTMERDQLEAKKKKLVIAWLDGQLSKEECDNLSKDFETHLKEIDELCAQLNNYDNDLDRGIEQISNVALNIGEVYKSSIISEKHRILQLLLSNSVVDGKSLYFSITKPFDKLLISKGLNEWWAR